MGTFLPVSTLRLLLGACVCAVLLAQASASFGQAGKPEGLYYQSWGVVIGIGDYLVAPKLPGSVEDAKAVAEELRKLGFDEVMEIYEQDANFRKLKFIFKDLLPRKVGRMDRIVVYFTGHAGTSEDMRGKEIGYLVPWDAQVGNAAKALTMDDLKDFSRRVMAKHVLFLLDTGISGWEVTPPQQMSLEGRMAPEDDTEKRAVQVLTAGSKGEVVSHADPPGPFVKGFLAAVNGAADSDNNGWLMASEVGDYVVRHIAEAANGKLHPQFARLDGDGDTILIEGDTIDFRGPEPRTAEERKVAAQREYELAFAALREAGAVDKAIERLKAALRYEPTFGDAYVLRSFLYLDFLDKPSEALVDAEQGVKYSPQNPDAHYTLGLVLQRKGQFKQAEEALRQALAVNPNYTDVYLTLGDLYAQHLKDKDKSIEAYQRYLETGGSDNRAVEYLKQAGKGRPSQ